MCYIWSQYRLQRDRNSTQDRIHKIRLIISCRPPAAAAGRAGRHGQLQLRGQERRGRRGRDGRAHGQRQVGEGRRY